ncbi:MAG TPA: dienelactone hydrolase family protein [Rhodospirillales bacterium]|nr:dienelactone hydrolase family protein [Rhodospirillales bacterium]
MTMQPTRRELMAGLAAAAPLAAVLADPGLARAAAAALEEVSLITAGGRPVKAALALPAAQPAPSLLLIHEWWGLNDQIKAVAAECAKQGYGALAVDLYGGRSTASPEEAQALMQALDPAAATDTLVSWAQWLRARPNGTAAVAVMGWCLGGGWALNASIATPMDATVIYYGRVEQPAERLARLKGPVLGHFATRDVTINRPMVEGFEREMKAAGKALTVYWYDADHAFANPSGGRYDEADAALAWERTLAFLRANLS